METKASYTIVGAFVLSLIAGLFVFVVWLAKVQLDQTDQPYFIFFTGTVTGLVEGSPVRYRGVAVGTVTDISINPDNVEQVRVTVEVPEETPIKTDAVATLEPVGVTGGVYVEIAGGSQQAPLLRAVADDIPVIPSRPSSIAAVLDQAPKVLANLTQISERVALLLDDRNRESISTLLANLAAASNGVNTTVGNANALVAELRQQVQALGGEAQSLVKEANQTLGQVGDNAGTISAELAQTSASLRKLTESLVQTSNQVALLVEENREPLKDFTNSALYDFGQLMIQLQDLAANLSRVTTRLERDPSELLFGSDRSGVEVE